jgi:hypothetical protein
MEQFSAEIYLNFTGFNQKCFIGRAIQVRRRYIAGRRGKPQHAKGVIRLLRTNQNMGFLPEGTYNTAIVDSHRVGCYIACHRLSNVHPATATEFLLALLSGAC